MEELTQMFSCATEQECFCGDLIRFCSQATTMCYKITYGRNIIKIVCYKLSSLMQIELEIRINYRGVVIISQAKQSLSLSP